MKKLMIALVAVALAAVANAATAKWSASNVYIPDTATKAGSPYTAFFVNITDYAYANAVADLAAGDASFLSKATEGATKTLASGLGSASNWGSFGNGQTVTGYLVILDSASVDTATIAYITSTQSGATGGEGAAASIAFGKLDGTGSYGADTRVQSNWYALAPEPTSGLMMLLGMGVLALRRRRA